MNKTEEEWLAL